MTSREKEELKKWLDCTPMEELGSVSGIMTVVAHTYISSGANPPEESELKPFLEEYVNERVEFDKTNKFCIIGKSSVGAVNIPDITVAENLNKGWAERIVGSLESSSYTFEVIQECK